MPVPFNDDQFRKLLNSYPVKAVKLLYDQHHAYLFSIAKKLTEDDDVSEDIVQETFAHVWENSRKLSKKNSIPFLHYLIKVVRYKSIDHLRHDGYVREHKSSTDPDACNELLSADSEIVRRELLEEVRAVISRFPKQERIVLTLKLEEDLGNQEIADRLKVTLKAVERSMYSGYKRFRLTWFGKRYGKLKAL